MEKSTVNTYKTELFAPIMKGAEGKYIAVLSDDSIDRDNERLSKSCIEKLGLDSGYIAGLIDHNNSVLKMVAEWVNRKVIEIDGHTALIAEPKFFKSNPNAKIIKGMLDEGAELGVSIGAIVKTYEDIDDMRIFKELELLEASFVAIPSNRHGRALAVAKSYNHTEVNNMADEKKIKEAVDKKVKEATVDFDKKLEEKDSELLKLQKDLDSLKKEAEDHKVKVEAVTVEAEKKLKESTDKVEALEKVAEDAKKVVLEKQKFADQGGKKDAKMSDEDAEKAFSEGKLPIMRG